MKSDLKKTINKWFLYPDSLESQRFGGFYTRDDVSQIRGFFPVGQNIMLTDSLTPTVRNGSELIGTEINTSNAVRRAWVFERRDGTLIEMKVSNGTVYFRVEGLMTDFEILEEDLTDTVNFTYAVISESGSAYSQLLYCNGVEEWRKWNGEYLTFASLDDTAHTITVSENLTSPAFLTGNLQNSSNHNMWTSVTDGSFRITINGTGYNVDGINFSTATSLDDVASLIQAKLRTATGRLETVEVITGQIFKITTVDSASSAITVATTSTGTVGTDISGATGTIPYLACSTGKGVATDREVNFITSSGSISFKNTRINYTSVVGKVISGCSSMDGISPVAGDILTQTPTQMTGASVVKSDVAMAHDGRLFSKSKDKESVAYYSKLDNPDDWTSGSSDGDGGAKELEGGGKITAFARDEKTIYIFKNRVIKTLEFKSNSDRVDVPVWGTLKPSDDKSSTTGAIGAKSTFHSPNGIIFTTADKNLLHLTRDANIDYPQLLDISDAIKPSFQKGVHDTACGIVYDAKVFYAYKQDEKSTYNDTVIVYDINRKVWYTPYIGWSVSDWTIINNELHFHSATTPNSYKVISEKLDLTEAMTTSLRTWSEDFGLPQNQKKASYAYIEIYQSDGSEITASILYDEGGFSGSESVDLIAVSDGKNLFEKNDENSFGLNPFGIERFGSNAEVNDLKKYRYIIELKKNIEFYNISIELVTTKSAVNYELIRFGYLLDSYNETPNKNHLK